MDGVRRSWGFGSNLPILTRISIAKANFVPDAANSKRIGAIAFLMLVQFFYAWAWSSVDVLRPAFRESLGLTLVQSGALYSAQVVGALGAALMIGQVEHAIGRKHLIAGATFGFGAAVVSGAFLSEWPLLLVQRLILGCFAGAVFPVTVGIIVDLFSAKLRGKLASLIDSTYFLAVIALGAAAALATPASWRLVLIAGGIPPMLFAAGVYFLIPDQERRDKRTSWREMHVGQLFTRELAPKTIGLALMIGCSSSGSQAFSGWLTTYLAEVRHADADRIAFLLSCQFGSAAAGAFIWGWIIDRFGRRAGAAGMVGAAAALLGFLLVPSASPLFLLAYGFSFSAIVSLGPWIAELYPPELRSLATAIFQWGRFISLFSPIVTGALAGWFGLSIAMASASIVLLMAAAVWLWLPETFTRTRKSR
jgi:MFS family permease